MSNEKRQLSTKVFNSSQNKYGTNIFVLCMYSA